MTGAERTRLWRKRAMAGDKVIPPLAVSVDDVEVLVAAELLDPLATDNPDAIARAVKEMLEAFHERE